MSLDNTEALGADNLVPDETPAQKTILVVDDSADVRASLKEMLSNKGYSVRLAKSGPEAFADIEEKLPDLIMLDVRMSDMDGYETCKRLKADEHTKDLPIVFMSALEEVANKVKAFQVGGVDYITKPFEAEEVLARLRTHLQLRENAAQLLLASETAKARAREVASLNRMAEKVGSSIDLQEVLYSICVELVHIFNVRNAGIALIDKTRTKLKVAAFYSEDPGETDATGMEIPLEDNEATKYVIENKEPFAIEDAQTYEHTMSMHDLMRKRGTKGLLIVPVLSRSEVIGTIGMPAKDPGQKFSREDVALAKTIAAQVTSSIENARLHAMTEHALDTAKRDLDIGREIQAGFFPEAMPKTPGWEVAAHFHAARQLSGDFYDSFHFGDKGHICLVIADVCDKGVGAALFMVVFRSLIRALAATKQAGQDIEESLKDIVVSVNHYISTTHGRSGMFATVFLGILDPHENTLYYINGGHEPPVIVDAEGTLKTTLMPTGPAVGLMPDLCFEVKAVQIEPGDIVVAYTDGATDAHNSDGDFFTHERLMSLIQTASPSAFSLLKKVETGILDFIAGAAQFDDITLLSLRRMRHAGDERHEFAMDAKLCNLLALRTFIEQAAKHTGLPSDMVFDFKLAGDEACSNIIIHGYRGVKQGQISLVFEKTSQGATLTITDHGVSFNPKGASKPDLASNWRDRTVSGLGLFFINKTMDTIDYESSPEAGNTLTLGKLFPKGDEEAGVKQ